LFKLGDFGHSYSPDHRSPYDLLPFPGDMRYAPPEYRFGFTPPNSVDQREGADAYLLGSLIASLFVGRGATGLLIDALPPEMKPHVDPHPTFRDAYPYLLAAHTQNVVDISNAFPAFCREKVTQIYTELTHPDPELRGHPDSRASAGRLPGIDRYISKFDRLRKLAIQHQSVEKKQYAKAN
jgi:hypothetical protein